MATRLPRCFAAAAAAAAVSSPSSASGNNTRTKERTEASSTQRYSREDGNRESWRREATLAPSPVVGCKSSPPVVASLTVPSIDTLRASLQELLGSVRLVRVAHADSAVGTAGAKGEGGNQDAGTAVYGSEDGDKPEYIQRADEQAAQMKNQLRRPGQFMDQFGEVSQLTQVQSMEGFRLDMSKAVTPTFFISHNVFFANSQFPSGFYQGTLTVVGESDTMVRATMDAESNNSMEAHFPLVIPGLGGKLLVQEKNDLVQATAHYNGDNFSGQLSLGTGPVEISYNQAVTPQLSVGGHGQFSYAQRAIGLFYGFKYNTPNWAALGRLISGGANMVTVQYLRRVVPGRVSLAAEYQAQLGAGSQMMVGAEFQLKQSKMSASLDSTGKIDSALELKCGTFPTLPVTLTISSSVDHSEDKHTFGLALTCGQ